MSWIVEFTEEADEQLLKLDKPIRERIRKYVKELEKLPNPKIRAESLKGDLGDFCKYRVGDYRLICQIYDEKMLVLVVKIGHRSKVYRK